MRFPALALCLLGMSLAILQPANAGWTGSATADYAVKATVDSFVGKAASTPIVVADDALSVLVTFPIARMETGKAKRDEEMRHMFHADQHPDIVGEARIEHLLNLTEGGELPVRLTIAGVTQVVQARIHGIAGKDDARSFKADLDLSLTSFGLKPPSIMKIIKVADLVKVTALVNLAKDAAPAAQP